MKTLAILTLASTAAAFAAGDTAALVQGPDRKLSTDAQVQAIQADANLNRKCHTTNDGKFHNCFRTSEQIFEYVDALVVQNPTLLKKEAISTTVNGKTIYAYKLTSGASKPRSRGRRMCLRCLRFWTILPTNKPTAADKFNLYFVPIANIDGYDISWMNGKRLQRKNANEVDLNRNWPTPFKTPKTKLPSAQDYPGTGPFSEPETKGIGEWLKAKNTELAGWVDVHSFGGLILYPYGDTTERIGNGEDEKFERLGRNIAVATSGSYTGQTAASPPIRALFGAFDDYLYRTYQKPC
ncbi:hypothetical protein AaE_001250 [Aphanomyces astaci]|uniref:Peptidase M14 domain-containing protein n=1 Tax=Aphanomyces astaci TaxID=112090 RepID=A0A6A5AXQ5_APHAT|nr:hypothetical protein AaE_001250 [Aphanomyces astaci]